MGAADWYARRLAQAPQPPPTPPIHPAQPDTRVAQAPQTTLQHAQQIAQHHSQSADALMSEVRSGSQRQGLMAELASHFQGTQAANRATGSCPECGEARLIKPGPTYMEQCYHCGYNPRFKVYG